MTKSVLSLTIFLAPYFCSAQVLQADANGDGVVDASDVILLHREWKQEGDPGSGGSLWLTNGSDVYRLTGNVGIGTASPSSLLDVFGTGRFDQVSIRGGSRTPVILSNSSNAGSVTLNGPDSSNISLTSLSSGSSDDLNRGRILVRAENNGARGQFLVNGDSAGELLLEGPSGNKNVLIGNPDGSPDVGLVSLSNDSGDERANLLVNAQGAGQFRLRGPNGLTNTYIGNPQSAPDEGLLSIRNSGGFARADLSVDSDAGEVMLRGANGNTNVRIGRYSSDSPTATTANTGQVEVFDAQGEVRGRFDVTASSFTGGSFRLLGGLGRTNVEILASGNHGFLALVDDDFNPRVTMSASGGSVTADVGTFGMLTKKNDHPLKENATLLYSAVTASRPTITHSGVARLEKGRATVALPEEFAALADPDSLVVNLTPGSLASRGLAAEVGEDLSILVGELSGGTGSYDVFYTITAKEAGHEDFETTLTEAEFKERFGRPEAKTARAE